MKIIVDSREGDLFQELKNITNYSEKFSVQSKLLDIGDCLIVDDDDEIQVCFERKTMADAMSSIHDGRWSEQKHRILSTLPSQKLFYIIQVEDMSQIFHFSNDYSPVSMENVIGGIMNLYIRYDIQYIYLNRDTIPRYIYRMALQIQKSLTYNTDISREEKMEKSFIHSMKKKADNLTPATFFMLSLQSVPRISYKTASNIQKIFVSFLSFMDFIRDQSVTTFIELYKKQYGRSLGKPVVETMYYMFLTDPGYIASLSPPFDIPKKKTQTTPPKQQRLLLNHKQI